VNTIIQFDETIIAGYELPQSDNLVAFIGNNSIYIVSLNTFQITDTIYASNDSIKECGIVPNSDTICLLSDDNSICFVNCDTQDINDLVIDNNDDDQTITNIIVVDDNHLVIIKNDNTINVIEY
jgi:WD40 repeat protein